MCEEGRAVCEEQLVEELPVDLERPVTMAVAGNGLTVRPVRHSQRKRGEIDRPDLRSTAPALDPTGVVSWATKNLPSSDSSLDYL